MTISAVKGGWTGTGAARATKTPHLPPCYAYICIDLELLERWASRPSGAPPTPPNCASALWASMAALPSSSVSGDPGTVPSFEARPRSAAARFVAGGCRYFVASRCRSPSRRCAPSWPCTSNATTGQYPTRQQTTPVPPQLLPRPPRRTRRC